MKKIFILLLLCISLNAVAQEKVQVVYKTVDTTVLKMDIYYPPNINKSKSYPSIIFFFGGGWTSGSVSQFEPHARYFAERGMVCFLADYRVRNRQKTSPFESLNDAKSAIRYLRLHAKEFHIDPARIVASGGSAGGHLAAATALIKKYDDAADDKSVSCIPSALVLFNPVIDNGPGGYGFERIGEEYKDFSPLHNIREGAPPTIIFLGTMDKLIPVVTAEYYKMVMEKVGSRCDLKLYEGEGHGFFNYKNPDLYRLTVAEADKFLQSLGYLSENPVVEIK